MRQLLIVACEKNVAENMCSHRFLQQLLAPPPADVVNPCSDLSNPCILKDYPVTQRQDTSNACAVKKKRNLNANLGSRQVAGHVQDLPTSSHHSRQVQTQNLGSKQVAGYGEGHATS